MVGGFVESYRDLAVYQATEPPSWRKTALEEFAAQWDEHYPAVSQIWLRQETGGLRVPTKAIMPA